MRVVYRLDVLPRGPGDGALVFFFRRLSSAYHSYQSGKIPSCVLVSEFCSYLLGLQIYPAPAGREACHHCEVGVVRPLENVRPGVTKGRIFSRAVHFPVALAAVHRLPDL